MPLAEPITTLTDYGIALESLIFARMLWQQPSRPLSFQGWVVAFLGVAMAALLGGTWHSIPDQWPDPLANILWQGIILSLGLASFGMLTGSVLSTVPQRWQMWARLAIFTKSLVYLIGASACQTFDCAIADYGSAMLIVLLLHIKPALQPDLKRALSARWIIAGVLVSAIAIAVVASGFSPGFLTHNDLYHLIQMVALYSFYRGVQLFGDQPAIKSPLNRR